MQEKPDYKSDQERALDRESCAAERELAWWEAWHTAWEAVEAQGGCDGAGGMQYRRITTLARWIFLWPCQSAMRAFIREQANAPAPVSITAASLVKRQERQEEQSGGEN